MEVVCSRGDGHEVSSRPGSVRRAKEAWSARSLDLWIFHWSRLLVRHIDLWAGRDCRGGSDGSPDETWMPQDAAGR
jgi:hypothetical protein